MGRISRAAMFMEMARVASRRSTCFRLNVGAIITRNNRPVSIGWNGAPSGEDHCAGNNCPGIVPGNCGTLHAEANAVDSLMEIFRGNKLNKSSFDLYCTDSPCAACVDRIIGCHLIDRVFFEKLYRVNDCLETLQDAGIEVYMVTPAGYIVEYFSRQVVELP